MRRTRTPPEQCSPHDHALAETPPRRRRRSSTRLAQPHQRHGDRGDGDDDANPRTRSSITLLRKVAVASMLGVSTWSIDRWVKAGTFPKPLFISDFAPARWRLRDVELWLEKQRVRRRTKSFPGTRNLRPQQTQEGDDAA